MKAIILVFAFLLLPQLSFAATPTAWLPSALGAIVLSSLLLGLIYMVGIGFNLNDLKFLANEEAYQLIITIVMIAVFLGAEAFLNTSFGVGGQSLQQAGSATLTTLVTQHSNAYAQLGNFATTVGRESSKSAFCSLQGIGFSISPCGSYSALTTPVSLAFQALGASIAELGALQALQNFATSYAFSILLPLGIFLRTLKLSRGAGGLFVGLAAALYFFLPLSLLFMGALTSIGAPPAPAPLSAQTCNVDGYAGYNPISTSINYENSNRVSAIFGNLETTVYNYLYMFLVQGTVTLIACSLVVFASLRAISKLAGSEVDISSIMRLA